MKIGIERNIKMEFLLIYVFEAVLLLNVISSDLARGMGTTEKVIGLVTALLISSVIMLWINSRSKGTKTKVSAVKARRNLWFDYFPNALFL